MKHLLLLSLLFSNHAFSDEPSISVGTEAVFPSGFKYEGQTLPFYEEGIWTPTLPNGGTISFTAQNQRWQRVGNWVTVSCFILFSGIPNNTSRFEIGGLPFVPGRAAEYFAGSIAYSDDANIADWRVITGTGGSVIYFHTLSGSAIQRTNQDAVSASLGHLILTIKYRVD